MTLLQKRFSSYCVALGIIHVLRQTKELVGSKMVLLADIQYCIYADIHSGSEKVQKCAEIIFGWSLTTKCSDQPQKLIFDRENICWKCDLEFTIGSKTL